MRVRLTGFPSAFCMALVLTACGGGGSNGGVAETPALTPGPSTSGTPDSTLPADPGASDETGGPTDPPVVSGRLEYPVFEAGPVRPLAQSPSGARLFAVNTPANRLEIYQVAEAGLSLESSLPVGLGPVAVAARSETEVWVVNHLSDSVSIVDLSGAAPVVKRTVLVGDEPRDILFAGPGDARAFITTARRGQHHPDDPEWMTPGVGRASVWVFDAAMVASGATSDPETVLNLFGNTPRPLARSVDGAVVYAGVFHSGNRTTILPADKLDKAGPVQDKAGVVAPDTGLIVRFDGTAWRDATGRDWSDRVRFNLPDKDVFAIDAAAATPSVLRDWNGVGTTLFNMVVNPVSGALYVSNLESRNEVRFEGSGSGGSTLRGHFIENRITIIDGVDVTPRHLNRHIDYVRPLGTAAENAASLATPLEMAVSADGEKLYVAAFGSAKIGIFSTAQLEAGEFVPDAADHIELPGGGPSAVILDGANKRLYTLTRFDNALVSVDLESNQVVQRIAMDNPEPDFVVEGRPFLYDARRTSSRGDSSCAGCHLFGDLDLLSWDLGNPDEETHDNPNDYVDHPIAQTGKVPLFHPLKGPMTTQSLRGMANNGPLHWRGDKPGLNGADGESRELAAFKEFNGAFVSLLGRESELSDDEMTAFARFALALSYPPNPYRNLDNSLTGAQQAGRRTYLEAQTTGGRLTCNICHTLAPDKSHFGTSGFTSVEGPDISQDMKVPHLRNMYAKVGMFGMGPKGQRDSVFKGDQIAGFGFSNDGSVDTLESFLSFSVFRFPTPQARLDVVDFVLAFDSDMAPIVGQQVTVSPGSGQAAVTRLELLTSRASVSGVRRECDLVAHGRIAGETYAAMRRADGSFRTTSATEPQVSLERLVDLAQNDGNAVTFTCVPPGTASLEGL